MPDWLIALIVLWAYTSGFTTAWAVCHRMSPFWSGFVDGLCQPWLLIWDIYNARRPPSPPQR
jgi:hypothetical protein